MPICMCASTQPGNASRFLASKTCFASPAWMSGASRTIFPSLIAILRQSTEVLLGRTTRAFLITVSKTLSMRDIPDLYFLVGLCARRFHDRRPALDILAHEGREFLGCVTDSRRAFGLELLTQSRLSQRSNDRRMEFLGDCVRQARRREYPEPGGG